MNWLFINGWASPQSIFHPYERLFPNHVNYNWDFNPSQIGQKDEDFLSSHFENDYSIFCYSMGTLKALELSQYKKPAGIISVGGFPYFCGPDEQTRRRTMQISRMIKAFKNQPNQTLNDFYKNSQLAFDLDIESIALDEYERGLNYLKASDYSNISQTTKLDIQLIEGIQDAIVPQATSRVLMDGPGNRQVHQLEGGHGLLQNNIEEMSQLLKRFL